MSLVAFCAPTGTFRHADFDFSGTVLDEDTKEPIEGAFIVGNYLESRSSSGIIGIQADVCVKTKGTYSDKNGKYRLPIEKLNGISPQDVTAIKPGYFGNNRVIPPAPTLRRLSKEAFSNRDIYLKKQDPLKPTFRYGDSQEACIHAETREAILASIQFLRIKLAETERLHADSWRIRNIAQEIARLEALPTSLSQQK